MRSYEVGNRSIAQQAAKGGRNDTALAKPPNSTHRAKVLKVQGSTCQVATLTESGDIHRIYSLVEVPLGMTVNVDDLVTVMIHEMDGVPVILAGAGGGGCMQGLTSIGVLFD